MWSMACGCKPGVYVVMVGREDAGLAWAFDARSPNSIDVRMLCSTGLTWVLPFLACPFQPQASWHHGLHAFTRQWGRSEK